MLQEAVMCIIMYICMYNYNTNSGDLIVISSSIKPKLSTVPFSKRTLL